MYSHGIEIKAQRLTILIAERRSISWGSMFGSLRRKDKRSGQNIFPNGKVLFCVFSIFFLLRGFNAMINYGHQNCVHLFFKYLTWTRPH